MRQKASRVAVCVGLFFFFFCLGAFFLLGPGPRPGFLASRLSGFLPPWPLGFLVSWLLGFLGEKGAQERKKTHMKRGGGRKESRKEEKDKNEVKKEHKTMLAVRKDHADHVVCKWGCSHPPSPRFLKAIHA